MAMRITEDCICCGACEPECPQGAITGGEELYEIDPESCTGCPGQEPVPCLGVCPVECVEPASASPAAPSPAAPSPTAPSPAAPSRPSAPGALSPQPLSFAPPTGTGLLAPLPYPSLPMPLVATAALPAPAPSPPPTLPAPVAPGAGSDDVALLDRQLEELELSVRTANCFYAAGLHYLGELVRLSEDELLRQPSFGRKSLVEVRELLGELGLHLGMDVGGWRPPE